MPCRQITAASPPSYLANAGPLRSSTSYRTEAECNQACKEGACCEGTTCTVKPACQCQGTGKVFLGVGTTCAAISVNSGRCCFYNQSKTPFGFYRGVERVTRLYCESRGGTWTAARQCDDGICTADADCNKRTGLSTSDPSLNCGCTQCGTTAPNPLP